MPRVRADAVDGFLDPLPPVFLRNYREIEAGTRTRQARNGALRQPMNLCILYHKQYWYSIVRLIFSRSAHAFPPVSPSFAIGSASH